MARFTSTSFYCRFSCTGTWEVVNLFVGTKNFSYHICYEKMDIAKPCTHLQPAPSTSTQLISTSTQLHPPPPSSFQPPPSSLQYPQQYLNQNIARNWTISPNLGWQIIKSCPFWLEIGTHGILEVLILNPDLNFEIPTPKSIFRQIWAQKVKGFRFVWKLAHMVSEGYWFLFQH